MSADAGATDRAVSAGGAIFSLRGVLLFAWRQVRRRRTEEEVDINAEEGAALAFALAAGLAAASGAWHRWEALAEGRGPELPCSERRLVAAKFAIARGAWSQEASLRQQS